MEKGDLTYRIIGCAMKVHQELGRGFMEYVYCRALAIELQNAGIGFQREVWLPIHYKQWRIAFRRADFLCDNNVIIEAKAKAALENADLVQAKNTTERLNVKAGLLLNFGGKSLEYKHIFNRNHRPESEFQDVTPKMVGELGGDLFESRHYLPDWLLTKMHRDHVKQQKQQKRKEYG